MTFREAVARSRTRRLTEQDPGWFRRRKKLSKFGPRFSSRKMLLTEPDARQETETAYEFEPFELVFLHRRDEILELVALSRFTFQEIEGIEDLSKALRHSPETVSHFKKMENRARKEIQDDL